MLAGRAQLADNSEVRASHKPTSRQEFWSQSACERFDTVVTVLHKV